MSRQRETLDRIGEAAAAPHASARRTLAAAGAAHALHDGYTDLIYVLLPVWQVEFGLGFGMLAALRGLYAGSMAALQVPAGRLAEWWGGRSVLALGTVLAGLGYALAGFSGGLIGLCAGLFISGAGSSTQHPVASAAVSRAYGKATRGPLGTYNFSGDLGKAALPALIALMLTMMSWRQALWLAKLEREYGAAAADNAERRRPTMRGFKIAHRRLGKQLRTVRARVAQLFDQRRDVPKRMEIRDINGGAVVKLAPERKHLTDIIKMVAYQAERDLFALLRSHYARVDQEGRTLLHELFATAGDIHVTDRELQITLAPLSSPHRTRAAQALCEVLDQTATIFPGSRLRMRFAVRPPPRIGLAFPGSPPHRSTETVAAQAL
jgi:hypothetical protein